MAALHAVTEVQRGWAIAEELGRQREWARDSPAVGALALAKRPLTADMAVLRFAAELVHHSARSYNPDAPNATRAVPPLGCALWELLYGARRPLNSSDEPTGPEPPTALLRAAGNAASMLNWAAVPFSGRNLRGLVLGHGVDSLAAAAPFAVDLQGAVLHGTDMTGALLRRVRLEQALLDKASLRNAALDGVQFGEYAAFRRHMNPVTALITLADGDTIYSGDADGTILCWNRRTPPVRRTWIPHITHTSAHPSVGAQSPRTFERHMGSVDALALSPDGKTLFSGSDYGSIHAWSPESGAVRWRRACRCVCRARACSTAHVCVRVWRSCAECG